MCVCNRPPVRAVCTDYEVVVFQPWAVTPPHLYSVAIVTNLSCPPATPYSTILLDPSFPSYIIPPPHQHLFIAVSLSLFATSPTPSPGTERRPPVCCLHLLPASLRRLSLRPDPRTCVFRHFP